METRDINEIPWDDYTAHATFRSWGEDGTVADFYEETIGEVSLPENASSLEMPIEIEINGIVYKAEL